MTKTPEWTEPGTLILDAGGEYWVRGTEKWFSNAGVTFDTVAHITSIYGEVRLMFDPLMVNSGGFTPSSKPLDWS